MKGEHARRKIVAFIVTLALIASTILLFSATALALTWNSAGSPSGGTDGLYGLDYDGDNLFVGCLDGEVYYNSDPSGGGPWLSAGIPNPAANMYGLAHTGAYLYAGCSDGDVYRKANPTGGGAWASIGNPGALTYGLTYNGTNLYAGCNDRHVYWKSLAWIDQGSPGGSTVYCLAHDDTYLYAGCANGNVY